MSLQSDLIEQRKAIRQRLGFYGFKPKPVFIHDLKAPRSAWPRVLIRDWILVDGAPLQPSLEKILAVVGKHYGFTQVDLLSHRRPAPVALARHVAFYLSRHMTLHSYPDIADFFGGRDHSTIIRGVEKIQKRIEADELFKREIEQLKVLLSIHTNSQAE